MLRRTSRFGMILASVCGLLSVASVAAGKSVCINFFPGGCTASGSGESASGSASAGPLFGQTTVTVNFETGSANDIAAVAEIWSGNEQVGQVFDFIDDGQPASATFIVGAPV